MQSAQADSSSRIMRSKRLSENVNDKWECVALYTHCPFTSPWHVTSTQGKLDTRQIKSVLSATLTATEQHPGNNTLPTQHLATKSRYFQWWSKTALPTVTAKNEPRPKLTLSKHGVLKFLPYEKFPRISELGISNYSWTSSMLTCRQLPTLRKSKVSPSSGSGSPGTCSFWI